MMSFVDSLNGRIDYYTFGEVFLPIKSEISSVKIAESVYGASHRATYDATMKFLRLIDANWETITKYKKWELV